MKILKFIKPMPPYIIDDIAAFDDISASKLIETGYAAQVDGDNNADNKGKSKSLS